MYCRYCGKQIDEDSVFCRHCGKPVSERTLSGSSEEKGNLITNFTSLQKKYQIAIILYVVWLLCWMCYLLAEKNDSYHFDDYLLTAFFCTILLPFIIVSSVYIFKLARKNGENIYDDKGKSSEALSDGTKEPSKIHSIVAPPEAVVADFMPNNQNHDHAVVRSEKLTSFAFQKGRMQIVIKESENSQSSERYCLFTDVQGKKTRVDFNEQTEELSSIDIANVKELLCVNELENGKYELAYCETYGENNFPF